MASMEPVNPGLAILISTLMLIQADEARSQSGAAQTPTSQARQAEMSAKVVEKKALMVDRLLFNSPVAARVSSSQSDDARRHLTIARDLYSQGRALAAVGQLPAADAMLNRAIAEIGRAQQLVPDQTARLVQERARYEQLTASVSSLMRTYQLGLGGQGTITLRPESTAERGVTQAMAAVERARTVADNGQVAEANRILDEALSVLLSDAVKRHEGQTVVYDRRFANTRDEFAYELARHRSFEGLVPLAVTEYRPSKEAMVLIERYVQQARAARERAEAQAAASDHASALLSVAEGTDNLQRALQAAGLSVPQTMGSQ